MEAPSFPQIPIPDASVDGLLRSMRAVISTLQLITGTEQKSRDGTKAGRNMAHVFLDNDEPTALNDGDLWLRQGSTITLNVWNGTRWVKASEMT